MPLLDLNDDCLREIASWLPAREMVLSFRLSCKVLHSAAREDLIDRAIVTERPVLGALLVRGRAVIRTAYAELRRAELPASEDAEHWKKPLRALSEFRFYVALDVGREWASSREALASAGSDTFDGRLDFAEHQPSLANGMISLPMSGPATRSGYDYDGGVWRDEVGGVHVVVVDVLSGKMMKLVDAPVLGHTTNFTHNHYECQRLSGVIYDSAPCYLHAISGARAFSYGLAQGEMARSLITALLVPVFVVWGAVGFVASGGVNFQNEFWERCVQYPFAGPELYLFSDSDALCDTTSLEALIAKRAEDKGADKVMSHNFKTTPHVLHMRFEKDEYERARSERGGPPDHVVRPDFATHLDLSTITRYWRQVDELFSKL
ncbi:hypothetical protein TeGR_g5943 [Tetraparma gracilis]|uniref:F-box domain-containing protein n=1 Tax=Tetraparma gracilis TaxID=2962635 RepID=A0ABQ6MUY2_9STRA|nr:hypothetical protein TeGR_g5943 [Tetraparma gracilis]